MISEAEISLEVPNASETAEVLPTPETCKQGNIDKPSNSVHVQTLPMEYFVRRPRNQGTQTINSKTMVTKGTQTYTTSDMLSKYFSKPKLVSTCSQTDPVNMAIDEDEACNSGSGNETDDVSITKAALDVNSCASDLDLNQSVSESDDKESCDMESCSEYSVTSGEESEVDECLDKDEEVDDEPIILTSEKSIQDQLKFIICEESIATTFSKCLKCGSPSSVSVTSRIGSYCTILISCSSSAAHNISWSTGPLINRLPAVSLLMAASILSTGMESNKTIRFMESLNILCFKRRELSNIQSAYIIPATINTWKMKQNQLLEGLKGKSVEIASDMRVDSPGHCGLLGAGSTLDGERNVILDTQIIKVTWW